MGEISFPNRKALALFVYLATESDHVHSRESLLGLLWPELPTVAAQNNLRVTWSQLRKRLGNGRGEAALYLIGTRLELSFNPNSAHCLDVTRFLDLLETSRAHQHPNRLECSECAERLAQAVALVRGRFLGDFSLDDCPAFEEWLFIQRERLHLQITTALEELADFHEHAGHLDEANKYVQRLLEFDPLREDAHRQLMRLLSAAGRRSAALDQYETCRRLLANELGVAPAPETVLLAEQIRALAPTQSEAPRHNLPPALSRFIGRKSESARLGELLTGESGSVVTLAGPGGVGKTRLALQVAHNLLNQFADGVWLVELAGLNVESAIPTAIASALKIVPDPRRSLTRTIASHLHDKSILLVLDNCEHLIKPSAKLVKTLCEATPGLRVLATSRIPLHLEGELVMRLHSLPSPPLGEAETLTASALLAYDAVQLFASRAMQALLGFSVTDSNASSVAQICAHLDGIPLAIELAAARTGFMTVEDISRRLDQRFRWLRSHVSGNLPRQQTLRALIDWSYDLLNERERLLFQRLSVFAGGWALEAAEAIDRENDACADTLGSLVDQSLIIFGQDAEHKQYRMHETIRMFAFEKLSERGDDARKAVFEAHNAYFTGLVAAQQDVLQGTDPQAAIKLIQENLDNVREAWRWGTMNGHLMALQSSVTALSDFYETVGLSVEGEQMLAVVLSALEGDTDLGPADKEPLQLDLLTHQASLLTRQAKLKDALQQAEKALALAECFGDPYRLGRAYLVLGLVHYRNGELHQSCTTFESGLVQARKAKDRALEGELLRVLGRSLQDLDQRQQSDAYMQQALQIMRRLGNRKQEQAILLYLGASRIESNDYVAGRRYLEEALQLNRSTGNRPLEARIQNAIGFVNAAMGELEAALPYHARSRKISHEIGDPMQKSHACHNLCTVNRKLGRLELAEQWGKEALLLAQQNDLADPEAYAWMHLGYVFLERGKLTQAEEAFVGARDTWLALERWALAMESVAGLAGTKWKQGEEKAALSLVEEVIDYLANHPLAGVDEPIQIYLTCYHVLRGSGDSRAVDVLRRAHDLLMANAEKVSDPSLRSTFLERVPAHRELIQLWEARQV